MSDPIRDRLDSLRTGLIISPAVTSFHYQQEDATGDIGYFRVRCVLTDGSELQLIERFRNTGIAVAIEKYSFHWQRRDGLLICRWDNAPHYPDFATFPHHIHQGDENTVQTHVAVDVFAVLEEIEKRLSAT